MLATVGDHLDEELRLRKLVGRLATYLQGYGDLLVRVNGWDPAVLARFRADDLVSGYPGAFDAIGTTEQLRRVAGLLPEEWLAASATGTPERCAARVLSQFDAGADSVILHGATPPSSAPCWTPTGASARRGSAGCPPTPAGPPDDDHLPTGRADQARNRIVIGAPAWNGSRDGQGTVR